MSIPSGHNFLPRLAAILLSAAATLGVTAARQELTPAFPGAEGWGRYTTGGRGGKVYHVSNLNDAGYGSLRYGVEMSGARTIVFDVSGTIHLTSKLNVSKGDLTIAGQTAPGDGICIADYPFTIGAPNVIVRYVRFRPGNASEGEPDALGCSDTRNIIVDHCSMSWSVDECCSVYGNRCTTVQWCIISQSLRYGGHSKETHGYGGMMGGEGATYHHNLLVHHDSRCPRLGERPATGARDTTDLRNNVMYNWSGQGCYGAENMNVNSVNNYYKPGAATQQRNTGIRKRICGVDVNEQKEHEMYLVWATVFADGNVNPDFPSVTADNWTEGIWQQIDSRYRSNPTRYNLDESRMHLAEPVKYYHVTTHSAETAYERVLDYAGASLSRDSHDALMVSDTRSGEATYTGTGSGDGPGIIDSPWDNRPADAPENWNPWPTLRGTEPPVDTDRDGMPDAWERARGLDPNDPADGNGLTDEGYTNLELYMNSLVAHITEAQNAGGTADGFKEYYPEALECYELSSATRHDGSWDFDNGLSIAPATGTSGGYGTSGEYIRLGRDIRHVITLPAGISISRVEIEGRGRYTSGTYTDAHLVELNGVTYTAGTYSLPRADKGTGTVSVSLAAPAKGQLTMTFSGNNPECVIRLYTADSGVADIEADGSAAGSGMWYDLRGIGHSRPDAPGVYIHNGRKMAVTRQ